MDVGRTVLIIVSTIRSLLLAGEQVLKSILSIQGYEFWFRMRFTEAHDFLKALRCFYLGILIFENGTVYHRFEDTTNGVGMVHCWSVHLTRGYMSLGSCILNSRIPRSPIFMVVL